MPFKLMFSPSHHLQNRLQTVLLIGAMTLLFGLCGSLLLGEGGFLWITLLTLMLLLISPQLPIWLVMRLYRAEPLNKRQAPELTQILEVLAQRGKLEAVPELYYVPSSEANAFTIGTVKESAVAITDGLLRRLTPRELAGVLAHEVSHLSHHDIEVMGLADTVSRLTGLMSLMGLLLLFFSMPLWLLGLVEISWFGVLLLVLAPNINALLQAALSRTREFYADLGAAELTGDPKGLASALLRLESPSHNWLQRIFHPRGRESAPSSLRSHPPTAERVQRLLSLAEQVSFPQEATMGYSTSPHSAPSGFRGITRRPRRHWSGLWY